MNSDTAVEESSLLCDDTQFVVRLEGTNHPYPQENSGNSCKHGIKVRVDLVPDVAHEIKSDYWHCGHGCLVGPHQTKASRRALQQDGIRRPHHTRWVVTPKTPSSSVLLLPLGGRLGVRKMSTKSDASYRHREGELKEKGRPITEVDRVHQQPLRRPKPQR